MQDEDYRRHAAEAQGWADKAKTDYERSARLRVAQRWLSMLRRRPRTDGERFEAAAESMGTKQDISTRSQ
jgi:hypothetical protein